MELKDRFLIGGCRRTEWAGSIENQTFRDGTKFARPGSKAFYGPDQNCDAQHIALELELDVPKHMVKGKCTTILKALHGQTRSCAFNAVGMKIISVTQTSGQKLRFAYKNEQIHINFPKTLKQDEIFSVIIEYSLTNPHVGIYFIGPDKHYPKKPVHIWTHGETEEARYWFPCIDAPHDKATTEMIATVPQDFFALSNGALLRVQENKAKKTKTYHWKQAIPHSPYLVTLVAGKFSEVKDEWDGIPITYYCEPGREEEVKRAFGKTPKMVRFFSEKIGVRYPYEKYAQIAVADFVMGGMEHTTATTQTDRVLLDERAYPEQTADWLASHELAHQWFGDLLTCKEWGHGWLNESFATYFEALFTEHDLGKDEFDYEMEEKAQSYFDESKNNYQRAIVTNVYRRPDDLFDRHLYEKGACVLHGLRRNLGEELFWKAIRHYVETFFGKAVETSDFINAIQDSTGRNMRQFFDQWIFKAGHPEYSVIYWWDPKTSQAKVQIRQKSSAENGLHDLPMDLVFITAEGPKKFSETIKDKKHLFQYKFKNEPLDVRLDPEHSTLKTLKLTKPRSMWLHQLNSDPHVMGRIEASREIAKTPADDSLDALIRAFQKEKFWGAANEIAGTIGQTKLPRAKLFLFRSLLLKNPKVRRGVVKALSHFPDSQTAGKLAQVFKRDPSYFVRAEALKFLANQRSNDALLWIKKGLNTPSWNDVIASVAVSSLSMRGSRETLALLKRAVQYGQPLAHRISAVNALSKCADNFPKIIEDLIQLAKSDPQVRVKHAAIAALGRLKNPRAIPVLETISKDLHFPFRTHSVAEDALLKIDPDKK